jgi:peptidoglycan/xylan/chitin deacetylase (PgdA/CDA1 family)
MRCGRCRVRELDSTVTEPAAPPANPYKLRRLWVAALRRIAARRSVILGYHGVARERRSEDLFMLQLDPGRFRGQLEMMIAAGFRFHTVAELAELAGGAEPPPGLAAISFDDAMRNNLTVALPILRELGLTATVYVPTGWLGGRSPWIGEDGDGTILTADELRELAAAGWELGAHTVNHADLSKLDYEGCREEIAGSVGALRELTGVEVQTFAYPFGQYGRAAVDAVRDCGLRAAVTTGSGSWDRYELTRGMIGAADPFPVVLLKLTDRYEPLLRTAPLRALRSASKDLRRRLGRRGQDAENAAGPA